MKAYTHFPEDIQIFKSKFRYMRDRVNKHSRSGVNNHNSKLTEEQVRMIRRMYRYRRITQKGLAAQFHIGRSTVNDIIHYRTWRHVAPYLERDEVIVALKTQDYEPESTGCVFQVIAIMAGNKTELIDIISSCNEEKASLELMSAYPTAIKLGYNAL